ncbi:MAG: sugar ABC transporter substrate-binding protein [bacterium]|nr:sugar ABC transporter substrate-binding protein [bacterium]
MKKNYRILLVGCIIIIIYIFGCSKKDVTNTGQSPTILTITTWDNSSTQIFRRPFVQEFERRYPNIKVKFIDIPATQYYAKLQTMIAGGTPPDAAYLAYDEIPIFATKKAIQPLEPYLAKSKDFDFSGYYPRVVEMLKFQGKIYAVSRDFTVFGLYYNKDMFDKAGVPYPDESWDWNKFLWAAKKLTKDINGDGKIDQYGFSPEPWLDSFIYWIWANGGEIVSEDLKTCIINKPEAVEALQFVADMRTKHKVAPSLVASQQPGQGTLDLMAAGKLGMYVNGSWMIGLLRQQAKFNWDVAPVPKGPKTRATVLFTVGMVIPTGSKHPNEAWEYLKYLGGPAGQSFFGSTKIASGIPAIKSIAESTVFIDPTLPPEHIHVLLDAAADYARPLRLPPQMHEIYEVLIPATDELWLGRKTAKQFADELKPKIDKILAKPITE